MLGHLRLSLRNADFTTVKRIAIAVNDYLGMPVAEPLDPSTVQLTPPQKFSQNLVAMLTEIEQLQVEPDEAAKIVIDERSGLIVIGRNVRVSTVAVAQGNLTVNATSQPAAGLLTRPLGRGAAHQRGRDRGGKKLAVVHEGVSLQQIVDGLNALGIGPRDLITILQAIKAAGAIQADNRGGVMTIAAMPDISQSIGSLGDSQSAQAQAALKIKGKAKAASEQFEAMFLNSTLQQMFTKMDGDRPFGGSGALKVSRSFLTDQYARPLSRPAVSALRCTSTNSYSSSRD